MFHCPRLFTQFPVCGPSWCLDNGPTDLVTGSGSPTFQLSRNAMHAYSHFCPLWTQRSTPACYEVNTWALHYPRPCAEALYHLRKFSGSKGWELEFLAGIAETSPWRQQSDSGLKLWLWLWFGKTHALFQPDMSLNLSHWDTPLLQTLIFMPFNFSCGSYSLIPQILSLSWLPWFLMALMPGTMA